MKPWTEAVTRSTKIVFRTNSSHSAMEAVKAGCGLAVFPSYSSKSADLVESPIDLNILRDIWLVSHEETNKGARIRAVIDYIRELFRRDEREWFSGSTISRKNSMAA